MATQAGLLKELQKQRGIRQYQVAELLGVSESFISKIVHGHRYLGPKKALAAARMLGIPLEAFFQ